MLTARTVVSTFSIAMMILGAGMASGQNYPTKAIRIYTSNVGSGNDAVARMIAQGISGTLGQPVIVENRGSTIAAGIVAKSPADGYSLLLSGDLVWLPPLLRGQPDAILDFAPISLLAQAPNILVVHPTLPVKSVKELIALARARPGELNFSSSVVGNVNHIAGELLNSMAKIKLVSVIYKGNSASLIGLASGESQLAFSSLFPAEPHIKSGRVRALAVTSARPSALVVGLPTIAATVPGYELTSIDAMFAPAKTPVAIINRLNQEVVRFLRTKDVEEKYRSEIGADVIASSPEELGVLIRSRITIIGKVIKDAGIKVD